MGERVGRFGGCMELCGVRFVPAGTMAVSESNGVIEYEQEERDGEELWVIPGGRKVLTSELPGIAVGMARASGLV